MLSHVCFPAWTEQDRQKDVVPEGKRRRLLSDAPIDFNFLSGDYSHSTIIIIIIIIIIIMLSQSAAAAAAAAVTSNDNQSFYFTVVLMMAVMHEKEKLRRGLSCDLGLGTEELRRLRPINSSKFAKRSQD